MIERSESCQDPARRRWCVPPPHVEGSALPSVASRRAHGFPAFVTLVSYISASNPQQHLFLQIIDLTQKNMFILPLLPNN